MQFRRLYAYLDITIHFVAWEVATAGVKSTSRLRLSVSVCRNDVWTAHAAAQSGTCGYCEPKLVWNYSSGAIPRPGYHRLAVSTSSRQGKMRRLRSGNGLALRRTLKYNSRRRFLRPIFRVDSEWISQFLHEPESTQGWMKKYLVREILRYYTLTEVLAEG